MNAISKKKSHLANFVNYKQGLYWARFFHARLNSETSPATIWLLENNKKRLAGWNISK